MLSQHRYSCKDCVSTAGRGGGYPNMEMTGMLVSFRGRNCRFWSLLGCFQWNADIVTNKGSALSCV